MSCCAVASPRSQRTPHPSRLSKSETVEQLAARRERLLRKVANLSALDDAATVRLEAAMRQMPTPLEAERLREAELTTGYAAARRAYDAASNRLWDLDKRILTTKARSVSDLKRQAEVVRAHCPSPCEFDIPEEMLEGLLASIEALEARHE